MPVETPEQPVFEYVAEDGWTCDLPGEWDLSDQAQVASLYLTANLVAFKTRKGLDRVQHFKWLCEAIWFDGDTKFVWHPWVQEMAEKACTNKYLGMAGCGSSGKTRMCAAWAIISFLAEPASTLVLVTTTTKTDADQRIWGDIKKLWQAMDSGLQVLGRMIGSLRCIRYQDPYTQQVDEKAGIFTIAGEKLSEKNESNKLIGKKQKRLILICDELPELAEAVVQAAFGNLSFNPHFQMIGLGNPKSYYDAFGIFVKPKNGWQSICVEDSGWETESGYCLHFDGTKSPNIGHAEPIWPIFNQANLDEAIERHHGTTSPGFWRMVRGFWCPTGEMDFIYCEADIIKFRAEEPVIWLSQPTRAAGLDPGFTNGGDECWLTILEYGISAKTLLPTICLIKQIAIVSDVTKTDEPHAYQIIHQAKKICEEYAIDPRNCAYDSTGGGGPFGDIIAREWSPKVLAVNFGGNASDDPIAAFNGEPACERYADRVTELWFGAHEYIRSHQIKGLQVPLVKEMCMRKYRSIKRNGREMPEAESKPDMKIRLKHSPDKSDSYFTGLAVVRERLGFGRAVKPNAPPRGSSNAGNRRRPGTRGVIGAHYLQRG